MIKSWSYSRYKTWKQCPRKAKYLYIEGLKEPENKWAARGTEIHKMAEDYLNGIGGVPEELKLFRKDFQLLRKEGAVAEQSFSLDSKWGPADWGAAWVRGRLDALIVADPFVVIDFKTGKIREDHKDQLSLYALVCFLTYPYAQDVTVELWYLDSGDKILAKYWRDEMPTLLEKWESKVRPMLADTTFPYNPGPLCNYCHFRKANGGPCEF